MRPGEAVAAAHPFKTEYGDHFATSAAACRRSNAACLAAASASNEAGQRFLEENKRRIPCLAEEEPKSKAVAKAVATATIPLLGHFSSLVFSMGASDNRPHTGCG